MKRRDALKLLIGASASTLANACRVGGSSRVVRPSASVPARSSTAPGVPMPVLFLAHGAPMLLDDTGWVRELGDWAHALPRPRSILVISAHWEERPLTIGATERVPLVYDFYGFPQRFYQLEYASPGAPGLATRVRSLLTEKNIALTEAPARGLDHGTYIPLMCMYPDANIPVLQISMPSLDTNELLAVGRALAPLRRDGVLIIGSGFLTHNMRAGFTGEVPAWAREFDHWAEDAIARRDIDSLLQFETRAPAASTALPTTEHFVPLIVAAGAVADDSVSVRFPITGFWASAAGFTRRSVQFG